ncbi:PspC domain-containing protein [Pseudoalteromonas sp. T1lg65]|uniref:PspC domain-containing protein n=1 Tax=Pseudoalteromonas sp. T1lg65 TaxID=2077101 RepID=UPI003F7AB381
MNSRYKTQFSKCTKGKKIGGVCTKLAHRFDIPVWLTRLITVLMFFKFPMFVVFAYAVAWFAMPDDEYCK